MKKITLIIISTILILFITSSCSVYKLFELGNEYRTFYKGTIVKKDASTIYAYVEMPQAIDKTITYKYDLSENSPKHSISANELEFITLSNIKSPDISHRLDYIKINKNERRWANFIAKSEELSAYLLAGIYNIDNNGRFYYVGYEQQQINVNGTISTIKPSYSLYLQKKGTDPSFVSLIEGINFQGSTFRSGISDYLQDDKELCRYIRELKWGIDDLDKIIKYYNPNRKDTLIIKNDNGEILKRPQSGIISNAFVDELMYTLNFNKPIGLNYGYGFALGIRSSFSTYFTYGAEVGLNQPSYIDHDEFLVDSSINRNLGLNKIELKEEYIHRTNTFNFNVYGGLQLPLNLKKYYLLPSCNLSLGGDFGLEFASFNIGPLLKFDFGIPLRSGSIFMIGTSYKYNYYIKDESVRAENTFKNYGTYDPINIFYINLGYVF